MTHTNLTRILLLLAPLAAIAGGAVVAAQQPGPTSPMPMSGSMSEGMMTEDMYRMMAEHMGANATCPMDPATHEAMMGNGTMPHQPMHEGMMGQGMHGCGMMGR